VCAPAYYSLMKVMIVGATGMVGRGALLEALDDPAVTGVLTLGRNKTGELHPKLREIEHKDLSDLSAIVDQLRGYDGCIYCLGVTSVGMNEVDYSRVTYSFTVAVAKAFLDANPNTAFAFVSGQGTDSTGRGRTMWARVKGKAENALLAMPFRNATMFRPGFIQPERGIQSRTTLYRVFYALARPFTGMLARSGAATTTTMLALALLESIERPPRDHILNNTGINELGKLRLERPPR
jgi:uncharacterized protein YbjT (DUF2867 family)